MAELFERSNEQRAAALKLANEVRSSRAQLKRDLKAGSTSIEDVLADPPACVATAKVFDILVAAPRYGRMKAGRLLNQCRISQTKTVGGLSDRQRRELVDAVHSRAVTA